MSFTIAVKFDKEICKCFILNVLVVVIGNTSQLQNKYWMLIELHFAKKIWKGNSELNSQIKNKSQFYGNIVFDVA